MHSFGPWDWVLVSGDAHFYLLLLPPRTLQSIRPLCPQLNFGLAMVLKVTALRSKKWAACHEILVQRTQFTKHIKVQCQEKWLSSFRTWNACTLKTWSLQLWFRAIPLNHRAGARVQNNKYNQAWEHVSWHQVHLQRTAAAQLPIRHHNNQLTSLIRKNIRKESVFSFMRSS